MSDDFIPTKGSLAKNKNEIFFEAVTFESYKSQGKNKRAQRVTKSPQKSRSDNEFNIKKAKHDVVKFGMLGFDPQQKAEAKIQLAIKLGAKPLKNKYKNYKQLKEERNKQKEAEKIKASFQQLGKNALGKSLVNIKKFNKKGRKSKSGLLEMYGKVKPPSADK